MLHKNNHLSHHLFSLLIALSVAPLHGYWDNLEEHLHDWKSWAVAGSTIAATSYLYSYWNKQEVVDPEKLKQEAEHFYQATLRNNKQILEEYAASPEITSDKLIEVIIAKGKTYPAVDSPYYYLDTDCREFAPILRGREALLHEKTKLNEYVAALIQCYESDDAASQAFPNLLNLHLLAAHLRVIANSIVQHQRFLIAEDMISIYRELRYRII